MVHEIGTKGCSTAASPVALMGLYAKMMQWPMRVFTSAAHRQCRAAFICAVDVFNPILSLIFTTFPHCFYIVAQCFCCCHCMQIRFVLLLPLVRFFFQFSRGIGRHETCDSNRGIIIEETTLFIIITWSRQKRRGSNATENRWKPNRMVPPIHL